MPIKIENGSGCPDSNREPLEPKSSILPLNYILNSLARIRTLSEGIKIPSATVTPRDYLQGPGDSNPPLQE